MKPPDADIDFGDITQPMKGVPKNNWQAPHDEECIDEAGGIWAFFLHFVDDAAPLRTRFGDIPLPKPTPLPAALASRKRYELPG